MMPTTGLLAPPAFAADRATFLEEVMLGLGRNPKELPCKYFYDALGSRLFEEICQLPEYYPTRTELAIMRRAIGEIVEAIGPQSLLIEYGSGSSLKTRLLLDHAPHLAGYIPIDISATQLALAVRALSKQYPRLPHLSAVRRLHTTVRTARGGAWGQPACGLFPRFHDW